MEKDNKYLAHRGNRTKQYMRIRLGLLQLINKPILNIFLLPLVFISVVIMRYRDEAMEMFDVPQMLFPTFEFSVNFVSIVLPLSLFLFLIETIGELSARRDEYNLKIAFSENELKDGCPLLMNRKKVKATSVTMREFYSNIPLKIWSEKIDNIADSMNVHFVESLRYGGKSNGKRIVIYTAQGREKAAKGKLYDEEF